MRINLLGDRRAVEKQRGRKKRVHGSLGLRGKKTCVALGDKRIVGRIAGVGRHDQEAMPER